VGPEAPALAPLQCDAAGDSGGATSTTPGSSRGGVALASPTKKSRKKMKIRGPRNFNLKSREVVSDTDSDEDSSAALAEEEDAVDVATAAGDTTAIKRGGGSAAAVVGRSSSSLLLVEKRRKTTTADAAPASADQRADEKRVVAVERRRSNNSNSLLLGLAGVEKDDGEEDEVGDGHNIFQPVFRILIQSLLYLDPIRMQTKI